MNKAYFVTCRTSTFNKYCRNIAGGDCKSLDEFASRIGIPAATEGSALGTTIAEKIADKISRLDEKEIATVSAELNTLFSIRESTSWRKTTTYCFSAPAPGKPCCRRK